MEQQDEHRHECRHCGAHFSCTDDDNYEGCGPSECSPCARVINEIVREDAKGG